MKLFDITLKDLLQSSRTLSLYIFAFVMPIGVSLLFFLMFGSIGGDGAGDFELPKSDVVIVNLDQGQLAELPGFQMPAQSELEGLSKTDSNMGQWLVALLQSDSFQELLAVTTEDSVLAAKSMVDESEADLAIILPENFTEVLTQSDEQAEVEIYKDPTLTFGPAIVESILVQILDSFSAAKITSSVALEQLALAGVPINAEVVQEVIAEATNLAASSADSGSGEPPNYINVESTSESDDILTEIVGLILGGMMVFFAFFTGSAGMQSILVEEERGTLPRLFTTPTGHREILSGKGLAAIITVAVQVAVLMLLGRIIFSIDWGSIPTTMLAALGIIVITGATGLFLVSLLTNTRQSGIVFGGVLTLTGMIGLIGVFTAGSPDQPEILQQLTLLVPQGWAMRALTISMDGGTIAELLPTFGGLMAWSLLFFYVGQRRMQKRFA